MEVKRMRFRGIEDMRCLHMGGVVPLSFFRVLKLPNGEKSEHFGGQDSEVCGVQTPNLHVPSERGIGVESSQRQW